VTIARWAIVFHAMTDVGGVDARAAGASAHAASTAAVVSRAKLVIGRRASDMREPSPLEVAAP
jgi:hypothetical protein